MDFTKVTRFMGHVWLCAKPFLPTGMVVLGVGMMTYASVKACIKTAQEIEPILDEHEAQLDLINQKWVAESLRIQNDPEGLPTYSEELKVQETMALMGNSIRKLVRVYWKPILTFTGGILLIAAGFGLEYAAKAAAVATGAAVAKDFENYRGRVIADQGAQKDFEYLHGVKKETVVETVVDPETGEEKTVVTEVKKYDTDNLHAYDVVFDELHPDFNLYSPRANLKWHANRQRICNDLLVTQGWLTLNQARHVFGYGPVKGGHRIGWLYLDKNKYPWHTGQNEVKVTIVDDDAANEHRMANGEAYPTLLSFNCDGDIEAMVEEHGVWPTATTVAA